MEYIMNFPVVVCLCSLLCLWASARLGVFVRGRISPIEDGEREHFGTLLGATLTLLGLLIGFSFSMAISRYDQRKNYEEEEANAIGTEYVRADLLPEPTRTKIQGQLVEYLDLRIKRYDLHAGQGTSELDARTAQIQGDMWSEVKNTAAVNPNAVMANVVEGMNDVLNRQGYTQAARLNRIPMQFIYSDLHQNIQERFNEAGVEICSPHFSSLRDGNTIAIPEQVKMVVSPVAKVTGTY